MKKSLFVLFLILVSLFSACSKKEENADRNLKAKEDQDSKEEIYNEKRSMNP